MPTTSTCEPFLALISRWRDDGRTAISMWQEFVERHDLTARYASARRFVGKPHGSRPPARRVVIRGAAG